MLQQNLSVLAAAVFVSSLVTGIAAADPPRPGTAENGLTENESATLWSRDADEYIDQETYRQRYSENRSALQDLANGTDISFKRPPATAATWTRNDFEDLAAGDSDTAVHPPHATLEDGRFIKDAHATIFAVHPSTRGHLDPDETPLYIAPNGTLRGFVDYRVRVPDGASSENTTREWSLVDHDIEAVRVKKDGEIIGERDGSHTPALDYHIRDARSVTLTFEATIRVRLKQTMRSNQRNASRVRYRTESRTVSDTIAVEIYDLSASSYYAAYPDGDSGVAIFQSRPWHGYTLTETGDARVRGVWRFYTARNTEWETLVQSTRTETHTSASDAIPVYVHAYPSRIGPRIEPVRGGPTIIETWGIDRPSPRGTIGENVNIGVVNRSYTTTYGVGVRATDVDREALQVTGIVQGVNASITEPDGGSERQLRRSDLTADIVRENQSQATVSIELRDNRTGTPIVLDESDRQVPIGGQARGGYITIAEQRVETNASGVALVTLTEPGIYAVRYQPGSWLEQNPAYVGTTATVRWHPVRTPGGWFAVLFEVGWRLLPFFVLFYAGTHLLGILATTDVFGGHP